MGQITVFFRSITICSFIHFTLHNILQLPQGKAEAKHFYGLCAHISIGMGGDDGD